MVRAVRNGTERNGTERNGTARHGPASLIPSADQKGKKRNDQVPTHAPRYLTGQSISLSREIIPGGGGGGGGGGGDDDDDDDDGGESHIRAR